LSKKAWTKLVQKKPRRSWKKLALKSSSNKLVSALTGERHGLPGLLRFQKTRDLALYLQRAGFSGVVTQGRVLRPLSPLESERSCLIRSPKKSAFARASPKEPTFKACLTFWRLS